MEKIAWLVLGSVMLVAAVFAGRNRRALYVGRAALGTLYLGAGALVNAVYLATGASYAEFADAAHFSFVRDTWRSLVVPNHGFFISLLIAFEVAVGVLILSGGRRTQLGLVGVIGKHLGLLVFGWVLTVWAAVMLAALVLLLRAERRWERLAGRAAAAVAAAPALAGVAERS